MANPNPSPATRFKKGNPGGPGAPKGPRFTTKLLQLIEDSGAEPAILKLWLKQILSGDYRYFSALLERVEGKVSDTPPPDDGNASKRFKKPKRKRPRSAGPGGRAAD